jgi:hypothetical protein
MGRQRRRINQKDIATSDPNIRGLIMYFNVAKILDKPIVFVEFG